MKLGRYEIEWWGWRCWFWDFDSFDHADPRHDWLLDIGPLRIFKQVK